MVAQLTKNERQLALIILLAISLWGLAMAVAGRGDPLGVHGAIVLLAGIAGTFGVISGYYAPEPADSRLDRYYDDPSQSASSSRWSGSSRAVRRRLGRMAAGQSGPDLRRGLVELRPPAAGPYHRRHLRLRRQCADRHVLPRAAAHLARPAAGPVQPVVRAARLQPVLRARRQPAT